MIVGLTGGIASGKSAVGALLVERGAQLVDADQVAREVVKPGRPGLRRLVERFGRGVLRPDGTLDRPQLAALAFGDDGARAEIEEILHPLIYAELADRLDRMDPQRPRVVEAALLVETLADARRWLRLDVLVVVDAPEPAQVERLQARGLTRQQARERIRAQLPAARRIDPADYVIDNSGSLEELERRVDALWQELGKG